jgi:putative glycosyltransferase (TIGR04372 family)
MHYLYIKFTVSRIISKGFLYIIKKIIEKILKIIVAILFLPFSVILHFLNFRITNIFTERIGHLAVEPACILNEYEDKYKIIIPINGKVANHYLLDIWSSKFIVINSRILSWIIKSIAIFKIAFLDCSQYERVFDRPRLSYKSFSKKMNLDYIEFQCNKDIIYLSKYLKHLGMRNNDWYVCVHAREEGYSIVDDQIQMHRNVNIDNYNKAVKYILSLGGWVIRLGDSSMKRISFESERYIDYPHSEYKNEMLDILLCKSAKFILGSSSGICSIGSLLGTPCAITNLLPTGDSWYTDKDIYLTKKIFCISDQRFLTLKEMMTLPVNNFRYAEQYINSGYLCVENTHDEIYNLTSEIFNLINNNFKISSEQSNINNEISSYRKINSNAYFSASNFSISFFNQINTIENLK